MTERRSIALTVLAVPLLLAGLAAAYVRYELAEPEAFADRAVDAVRSEAVPEAVAEAPDTTTSKTMHEDPSKLDQSGDPGAEKTSGAGEGGRGAKKGRT